MLRMLLSFLGYVASNKQPHLIRISLRIKHVAFSYRWPLVSFVSKAKPVEFGRPVHRYFVYF
jgi:hypothetical protein